MSPPPKPTLLILGGAGAQNSAVAKIFSNAGTYSIRMLTRSTRSAHASDLAHLANITLIAGDCYDDATLASAFRGVDLCFVNTNGFAIGEKNEIYWGIRMYEIARWAGVKHFVYSGLPYVSMNGGFDPSRRVPFVDGKGKVAPHVSGSDLAAAFEAVTGNKARYEDIPLQDVLNAMPVGKIGSQGSPGYDDPTLKTAPEHFGPWWQIFRESGGNTGLWKRDYELLDEIMPDRIKSVEQWMRKVAYDGKPGKYLTTGLSME
ncbi:NmrA-like family domain-containing protein 1 [Lachnellula cervina]|uniref:NmrA-like family domain-containing protein 1 n=1 Tax=Lachnellula cervina TaxID=1316786 RepID=A0A7D8UYT4_9HELO|nr:NmrA-like family domain-containing protein 1 [Lachnellula cervina]